MRILEWHIDRFGGLSNCHFSPTSGLNLILGDNESGKSTTMAFIRAMFYGVNSSAHSLAQNDRKRLMPWGEATMGGHLVMELKGRQYRIERTFGLSKRFDQTMLRDETTGQPIELPVRQSVGEYLFDVSEQEFINTVFIGQLASADVTADGGTLAKLTNLATTGDEQVSCSEIDARLRKAMVRLKAERGGGGLINTQAAIRDDLMVQRQQVLALENDRAELFEQHRRLDRERQQTRDRLAESRKLLSACQDWQTLRQSEEAALLARDIQRLDDLMRDEETFLAVRQVEADQLADLTAEERVIATHSLVVRQMIADLEENKQALTHQTKAIDQLVEKKLQHEELLQNVHSEMGYVEQEAMEEQEARKAAIRLEQQSVARAGGNLNDEHRYKMSLMVVLSAGFLLVASGVLAGYWVNQAFFALVPLGFLTATGFGLRLRSARKARTGLQAMERIALGQLVETSNRASEESRSHRQEQYERLEQRETKLIGQLAEIDQDLATGKAALKQRMSDLEQVAVTILKDPIMQQTGMTVIPNGADALVQTDRLLDSARALTIQLRETQNLSQAARGQVLLQSGYDTREALDQDLVQSIERQLDIKLELAEKRSKHQALSNGQSAVRLASLGSAARSRLYSTFPKAPVDLTKALQSFPTGDAELPDAATWPSNENQEGFTSTPSSQAWLQDDEIQPFIAPLTAFIEECRTRLSDQETSCARLESDLKNRFAGLQNLEDIDRSLDQVNDRINKMQADYDALALARERLDEAFHGLQQTFGPKLNQRSSEILAALTGGRYLSMRADRSLAIHVELPRTGILQESGFFSGGTVDQIYLALRLSVAELIGSSESRLPLCLDDVFVQYDDQRARAGLEFLRQYAKEQNLQVLLFSCHHRLALLPDLMPARLYTD